MNYKYLDSLFHRKYILDEIFNKKTLTKQQVGKFYWTKKIIERRILFILYKNRLIINKPTDKGISECLTDLKG